MVILSGGVPYSRGEPTELDDGFTEQQVATLLQSRDIYLDCADIEAGHTLPRRNTHDKQAVIVRFAHREHKNSLLKQCKKLKGSNVFMNEHLTKQNVDIAQKANNLNKLGNL